MWYVIQTETGKEQELVEAIERVLKGKGYKKCFIIRQECVRKCGGSYKIHIIPLFPSYVFAETESPEEFFQSLKQVPKFSKLLGNDGVFCAVQEEERILLCRMLEVTGNKDEKEASYLLGRSWVQTNDAGEIIAAGGFLGEHLDRIVKKRLRKRYVVIEIPFMGKTRRIQMGIQIERRKL